MFFLRYENTTMSSELEAVQALFEEKHIELSAAMLKVAFIWFTTLFLPFTECILCQSSSY